MGVPRQMGVPSRYMFWSYIWIKWITETTSLTWIRWRVPKFQVKNIPKNHQILPFSVQPWIHGFRRQVSIWHTHLWLKFNDWILHGLATKQNSKELFSLFATHCLGMINIYVKFHGWKSYGFKMLRTNIAWVFFLNHDISSQFSKPFFEVSWTNSLWLRSWPTTQN